MNLISIRDILGGESASLATASANIARSNITLEQHEGAEEELQKLFDDYDEV